VSALLPEGYSDLKDVPHVFFEAVRFALVVISFDELSTEERPPKRIWRDNEALSEWFDAVKRRRDEQSGVDGRKPIEDPVQNEAAKGLIVE
jgi:hypothetical protein